MLVKTEVKLIKKTRHVLQYLQLIKDDVSLSSLFVLIDEMKTETEVERGRKRRERQTVCVCIIT